MTYSIERSSSVADLTLARPRRARLASAGLWLLAIGVSLAFAQGCVAPGRNDPNSTMAKNAPVNAIDEEEDGSFWGVVSPTRNWEKFKHAIGQGPNENIGRQAFNEGEALLREQKYNEAAAKFTVAYKRWPDSPLEEDALMKAGESYFFADRYPKADDAYALLIKKYPNTQYLDLVTTRRFRTATYWQQLHNAHPHYALTPIVTDRTRPIFDLEGHALRVYERIRLEDPTGPLADDSIMRTATTHFEHHRFDDADYYFTLLRNEYPKSEHQYLAHILGLQAKLKKYQGADYEGAPLIEAQQLAQQTMRQFPNQLGDERQRIVDTQTKIRAQLALRDYQKGEYWHNLKQYGASRIYYAKVARDYPGSELAQQSIAKMEAVRSEPDVPKGKFDWVAKVIPESERNRPGGAVNIPLISKLPGMSR